MLTKHITISGACEANVTWQISPDMTVDYMWLPIIYSNEHTCVDQCTTKTGWLIHTDELNDISRKKIADHNRGSS